MSSVAISTKDKKRAPVVESRVILVAFAIVLAVLLLVARLWYLQVVCGEEYAAKAEKNRLRFEWLKSRRGLIYGPDTSVVFADSRAAWDLVLVPHDCSDPEATCTLLGRLLGLNADKLLEQIKSTNEPFKEVLVKEDVSKSDLIRVEEFAHELTGVYSDLRQQRRYLHGKTAGQILGYIGEIGKDELKEKKPEYKMGDLIGQAGLERAYESRLRGKDGQLCVSVYASGEPILRTDAAGNPYVEVDSYGRRIKEETEFREPPVPGEPVHLTLDLALQQEAERLLEGDRGAIVVLDANTGAILAMASSPGYDPNEFVTHGRNERRAELLNDPAKPMRNRAYQERYPPGSVFKIMLAIAALEEGTLTEKNAYGCGGYFHLPGVKRPWRCWRYKFGGHGGVDVVDALAYSCDVFFYNVGGRLGVDKIKEWCARLGLGEFTGIDLPGEVEGLVPSPEWKEARQRERFPNDPSEWRWYPGETINLSIGQGDCVTTPLQNAVLMAAVMNGGRRVYPHITAEGYREPSEPFISERTLAIVQAGMRKCIEKDTPPRGTGIEARIPGMVVLGKTGTAQAVGIKHYKEYTKEEDIPYELRDHALFIAGALDREPRIAVSVIIEHGLHGSSAAAPRARQIIEYFYSHRAEALRVARAGISP